MLCNACAAMSVAAVPGLFPVQLAPATAMRAAPFIFFLQCWLQAFLAVQAGGFGACYGCYGAQHLAALAPVPWAAMCRVGHVLLENGADCPFLCSDIAVRDMLDWCRAALSRRSRSRVRCWWRCSASVVLVPLGLPPLVPVPPIMAGVMLCFSLPSVTCTVHVPCPGDFGVLGRGSG